MSAAVKWFRELVKKILAQESRRRSPCPQHALFLERLEDRLTPTYNIADLTFFDSTGSKAGLVEDSSGNLFGTTPYGGTYGDGTVFEWVKSSDTISTLASFNGSNGANPQAGLVEDSSDNLFGTTTVGGTNNDGTVFEWVKSSGTISVLASTGSNAGLVEDSSGNLFGTTRTGGTHGDGTVFEWVQSSDTIAYLAFFDGSNGAYPFAGLVEDSSGNLFGTTDGGGANGDGTVFEWVKSSGTITDLASFDGSNGANPFAGLVEDSSGNLFGTTDGGGANGDGTVFEWVNSGGIITDLASFDGSNGEYPVAGLVEDSSGNLFGTTASGGANSHGTVFEWVNSSSSLTDLASLNGPNGADPYAGLIEDSSGNLFGTTNFSGASGDGTVFEWVNSSGSLTDLASFSSPNGLFPDAGLVEDSSGNLFGTTDGGGANGDGTVFEWVKSSGTITDLASFDGSNGTYPYAGLVEDSSGNLFGTTSSGGANGDGTVFEWVKSSGTITDLASFDGSNGAAPYGGLVEDSSGNLFGTTDGGGANGDGTVFEWVKSSGTITDLASFDGSNGATPYAGLVEDSSGNLFGTTCQGGANNDGTVFEWVNNSGTITDLASFDGSNGAYPYAGLVEDSSGNLFGTTEGGGANNEGTVFEWVNSSGSLTDLASFDGSNGTYPYAELVEDSSGNLFGTTYQGGANNDGTVFEWVNSSGSLTDLASFNGYIGAYPYAGLVEDSSGNLFGTTSENYYGDDVGIGPGTVFEVVNDYVTTNPNSVTLNAGQTATFTAASSNPLGTDTVQWQVNKNDGHGFTNINGATNTTLTISNTTISENGYQYQAVFSYQAVISNTFYTGTVTTSAASLTVDEAPSITSANGTTFTAGVAGTFTITTGPDFPTATTLSASGALPLNVNFTDNHNGTATLSGTPAPSTGVYIITLTADNGVGSASQVFALTVVDPPKFTSANAATFLVGNQGSFTVSTSPGLPLKTTLSERGALPTGISFKAAANGTATLSGKPAAYTGGVYELTIIASNAAAPSAMQTLTLTVTGTAAQPPTIISANSATFTVGMAGSFAITANPGTPSKTTLTESGRLPLGVVFTPGANDAAKLTGTPKADTGGIYAVTITASNGIVKTTQDFTLTVSGTAAQPPTITSGKNTTFTVGTAGTFTITTSPGVPTKTTLTESGALPAGVTFTAGAGGTGRLSGRPKANTGGAYTITLIAGNGLAQSTQTFTLTVDQPPAITSPLQVGFARFLQNSFTITTSGFPHPTLTLATTDILPPGVSFMDNGNGTATLSGTPTAGEGAFLDTLHITANNGVGANVTQMFTLVIGQSPIFTSDSTATFMTAQKSSFTITTSATPMVTLTETGTLPKGITFHDNGDGTATLSGKPATGSRGTYTFVVTASDLAFPEVFQLFTLTIGSA